MYLIRFLFPFIIVSCATVSEVVSPTDTSTNYTKTKSSNGETVYKRKVVKSNNLVPLRATVQPLQTNSIVNSASQESDTTTKSDDSNSGLYLEFSGGDGHVHLGAGLNYEAGNNFDLKGGVALFSGVNSIYTGFDLAARAKIKVDKLQPFVGIGGHLGDSKNCEDSFENGQTVETCEKKFLTATYSEIGIRYDWISGFYRIYTINEADIKLPVKYLWGVNINF